MEIWHKVLETLQYYAYYVEFHDVIGLYIAIFTLVRVKSNKLISYGTRRCLQHGCSLLIIIFMLDLYWAGCSYFPKTVFTSDAAIYLTSGLIYAFVPWVTMAFIMRSQRGKLFRQILIYIPLVIYEIICLYNLVHPSFFRMENDFIVRNDLYYVTSIAELYAIIILYVYGINETFMMSKRNRRHVIFALTIVLGGILGDVLYQQIAFMWTSLALCMIFLLQVFSNVYMERDMVTTLWNRTIYEIILNEYKKKKNVTYAAFDLNNLKFINDHAGHQAGDLYLRAAADTLRQYLGDRGVLFRIGGDEFAYISDTVNADLYLTLKGLDQQEIIDPAKLGIDDSSLPQMSYRIAYGVAVKQADESLEDMISRADKLMYEKKAIMKRS